MAGSTPKFKYLIISLLAGGALVLLAGAACIGMTRTHFWERGLIGPFAGEFFAGELAGEPVSWLALPGQGVLAVYEVAGVEEPVLALADSLEGGDFRWAQRLTIEDVASDGSTRKGKIHWLRLERAKETDAGIKVYVACDWVWGGREDGVIYLGEDRSFRGISLSW